MLRIDRHKAQITNEQKKAYRQGYCHEFALALQATDTIRYELCIGFNLNPSRMVDCGQGPEIRPVHVLVFDKQLSLYRDIDNIAEFEAIAKRYPLLNSSWYKTECRHVTKDELEALIGDDRPLRPLRDNWKSLAQQHL